MSNNNYDISNLFFLFLFYFNKHLFEFFFKKKKKKKKKTWVTQITLNLFFIKFY